MDKEFETIVKKGAKIAGVTCLAAGAVALMTSAAALTAMVEGAKYLKDTVEKILAEEPKAEPEVAAEEPVAEEADAEPEVAAEEAAAEEAPAEPEVIAEEPAAEEVAAEPEVTVEEPAVEEAPEAETI